VVVDSSHRTQQRPTAATAHCAIKIPPAAALGFRVAEVGDDFPRLAAMRGKVGAAVAGCGGKKKIVAAVMRRWVVGGRVGWVAAVADDGRCCG